MWSSFAEGCAGSIPMPLDAESEPQQVPALSHPSRGRLPASGYGTSKTPSNSQTSLLIYLGLRYLALKSVFTAEHGRRPEAQQADGKTKPKQERWGQVRTGLVTGPSVSDGTSLSMSKCIDVDGDTHLDSILNPPQFDTERILLNTLSSEYLDKDLRRHI